MIYISYINNLLKLFSTTIQVNLLAHTLKYVHYLEETQNLASVQNFFPPLYLLHTTRREAVRKMELKYPEGGYYQSVLRPRVVFNIPHFFNQFRVI